MLRQPLRVAPEKLHEVPGRDKGRKEVRGNTSLDSSFLQRVSKATHPRYNTRTHTPLTHTDKTDSRLPYDLFSSSLFSDLFSAPRVEGLVGRLAAREEGGEVGPEALAEDQDLLSAGDLEEGQARG